MTSRNHRPFTGPGRVAILFLVLAALFLGRALFPAAGEVLGGYDMGGYYYVLHGAVRQALADGHLPLWSAEMFNGFPLLADPQAGAFYPPAWLTLILPLTMGISFYMLFHIWLAGWGMFLLAQRLGGRPLPSILAGIVFAFSGLLGGRLWAGHSTVYAVDAWAPWLVLALLWAVERRRWSSAAIAGAVFGLALLAGHLPSFLYVGLIWAAFAGYLLVTRPGQRGWIARQAALMAGVGLALAAVQLIPFLQFSATTARVATADYAFATDYSLPPAHLITFIVPQFFGEPTQVGYWSVPTFEELTYYAGVLVLLALALFLARPTRLGWFYVGLMALGLWLALGRYGVLYKLVYDWLPPFRVVRAPARAAFLYIFAAAGLLAHTLSRWRHLPLAERLPPLGRTLRWTLSLWTVAGLAALAATGAVFMAVHPTETSGRLWQQVGGYAQALLVFLIGGGLVWAYLNGQVEGGRRRRLIAAALILLVTLDMWLFSYKFVRLEPVSPEAIWLDARAVIDSLESDRPDRGRVLPWGLPVFVQNGGLQVGLTTMFGYESLEPAAHIALTSSVADPRSTAYDVLGATYVLAGSPLDQFTQDPNGLQLAGQQGRAWVYRRPAAQPVARLVYATEVIDDDGAAVNRIHQPDFSAARTAILSEPPPCALGPDQAERGSVQVLEAADGRWRVQVKATAPALLVLAESDYPGWRVTVDGQPAESLTAYTTIKAVCVPAGEHLVEWRFEPTLYWLGGGVSLLALALVGVSLRHHRSRGMRDSRARL